MEYHQIIDFLYNSFPMFEKTGGAAYHPGLERIETLCAHFGHPHKKLRTVHIAGTNGKGSSSHLIASVLQSSGYKTGLFTSPHLKEFTERIKINGKEISKESITQFVNQHVEFLSSFQASFFEITTLMAFHFFAEEAVDIAVIETGMGGRLDSTNIIHPEVCLITNISFDHRQYLGDTLELIAGEKAGIIKEGVPVVIGEKQASTHEVFVRKASEKKAALYFAEDLIHTEHTRFENGTMDLDIHGSYQDLSCGLGGFYQEKNIKGVLTALNLLHQKGWAITEESIRKGFAEVVTLTGLKGRWHYLQRTPAILCDTAHNEAGIRFVVEQLKTLSYERLYVVLGMVKDKEIEAVLQLLPTNAWYFFTMPSLPRALPASLLYEKAVMAGLQGEVVPTVKEALEKAKAIASPKDLIYVGGSTFVVAEIM
jgi:dihydrofolate synthase/folylpolyglutamate synthase